LVHSSVLADCQSSCRQLLVCVVTVYKYTLYETLYHIFCILTGAACHGRKGILKDYLNNSPEAPGWRHCSVAAGVGFSIRHVQHLVTMVNRSFQTCKCHCADDSRRGFVNAFGTFAAFYQSDSLSSHTPAEISWIGSIDGFLLIFVGVISGPIFDYGYFRTMLVAGSLLFVFGIMMLSLATRYHEILLAQGVCLGLASGILYTPSLALVATSFTKRRGLAIGVATSGGSLGELHHQSYS
jgi:hypothetical protein